MDSDGSEDSDLQKALELSKETAAIEVCARAATSTNGEGCSQENAPRYIYILKQYTTQIIM